MQYLPLRGRSGSQGSGSGVKVPRLALYISEVSEDTPEDTVLSTLKVVNGEGTYTFSKTAGSTKVTVGTAGALTLVGDLTGDTSLTFTAQATNGVDSPLTKEFTLTVTPGLPAALTSLTLSVSTITQGEAVTINILGATAGSTITTASLPEGLVLNSGARTISGTPVNAETVDITLTETLADSPNSPLVSNVSITVKAPVEVPVDNTIAQQELWLTDITSYPPPLNVSLDATVFEDDVLQVQASDSVTFSSPSIDVDIVLDAAAISADALIIPGIEEILPPDETYFRIRIKRDAIVSPWSQILKHGDTTTPTITSASSVSIAENTTDNTVLATGTLTADEEIASWAVSGGDDAGKFILSDATAQEPVWQLTELMDFERQTSYTVEFSATDFGGNVGKQVLTLNVSDISEMDPSFWSPTEKSQYVDLSNNNLTATARIADVGADGRVRSTAVRAGKRYWEVTINHGDPGRVYIGCCTSNVSMTATGGNPGIGNGAVITRSGNVTTNTGTQVSTGETILGGTIGIAIDTDLGKIWFKRVGQAWFDGDPATGVGGYDAPTGNVHAFATMFVSTTTTTPNSVTANFGASAFADTLPEGFEAFV